jgi:polygalacturonase
VADTDVTRTHSRKLQRGLAALAGAALSTGLLTALPGLAAAATGVTLTVAKSGAEYTSVQAAVNAVPENSTVPYTILIGPGTYDETVTIPPDKPGLTLQGTTGNPADVVITAANYNGETDPAGGSYGTEGSATVHAQASDFTADYITFANTFDKNDFPAVTGTQAVAIAMEGDRQVYRDDIFYGHQDTLLSWGSSASTTLRQYVYDSTIEGDVDFIFGNGSLVVDRIQAALNACAGTGQAVVLAASLPDTAFLSAPLTIGSGEYLVIGAGATLYASRNAADYQIAGDPACGSIGTSSSGCNAFITVTGVNSGIEGAGFGSHQGAIDGRGGQDILGTSTTWWQVAATATAEGLKQVNPRLIQATDANNLTIYDLTLENSAKEHLYYKNGGGLLVWGLRIATPDTTYNTDGVDFDSSAYGTIRDSVIQDGDDCVAMQTNNATDAHITVAGDQCYGTHGISIGSETTYGLESILVEHNFIDGRDSSGTESTIPAGIRIKSYAGAGGTVTDVRYTGITMRSLQYPIDINPFYDPATGTSDPYFKDVEIDGATETASVPGAESVLDGYSAAYPLGLTLRFVHFDVTATTAQDANITEIDSNLAISGPGVTVNRAG